MLALGILGEAHARFVFFLYALIATGGVVGLFELRKRWSPKTQRSLVAGLVILAIGTLSLSVPSSRAWVENRDLRSQPLEMAASLLENRSVAGSCSVLTSYMPQMTFYSECVTDLFRPEREPSEAVRRLAGDTKFMFFLKDGKRQPNGTDLEGLIALSPGPPVRIEGDRDWGLLYDFGS